MEKRSFFQFIHYILKCLHLSLSLLQPFSLSKTHILERERDVCSKKIKNLTSILIMQTSLIKLLIIHQYNDNVEEAYWLLEDH